MIIPGLVSVTFREFTPQKIIALTKKAGLQTIEWGGDIHVPHGDLQVAKEVGQLTQDEGLNVSSYGSYYAVGMSEQQGLTFESVLETALALQTNMIRVWAGRRLPLQDIDKTLREQMVEDSLRIAEIARQADVTIAYEYHGHSLTETNESALDLMERVKSAGVKTFWQARQNASVEECKEGLQAILDLLTNVHVFYWEPNGERHSLAEGEVRWMEYLKLIRQSGRNHHALLEFVKDNSPEQLYEDAQTLKRWLQRSET